MKTLLNTGCLTLIALTFPIFASAATTGIYEFDIHDYGVDENILDTTAHNPAAGYVEHFNARYDGSSQQLSTTMVLMDATPDGITTPSAYNPQAIGDGFWMVLTDGDGPKHHSFGEYAILYADSNSGNISSYVYNGDWTSASWETPGEFIRSHNGALSTDTSVDGQVTYNLDIDVSGINSYTPSAVDVDGWKGIQFGEEIGLWVHPFSTGSAPTFNADGSIATMDIVNFGSFDSYEGRPLAAETILAPAAAVPVPAAIWLFASALGGLVATRRRRLINQQS